MPLHFYTDRRVLKATGLSLRADADLGGAENLLQRARRCTASTTSRSYNCLEPTAPEVILCHISHILPLFIYRVLNVVITGLHPLNRSSSFFELFVVSTPTWATRHRPCPLLGEASLPSLQDAAPMSRRIGTNTPPSPEGHLSSSSPLLGQSKNPRPPANQVPSVVPGDAGRQYSATVVLEQEDQGGVRSFLSWFFSCREA
ncbi:hypothetical protein LIER_33107 [Lithospermum erythrorhizon]|uniref:Uncharacterized protein n=1 Tax=Lithospermum erythrorhizon TaxID=34254 RepID=A0AAV3RY02_LITER